MKIEKREIPQPKPPVEYVITLTEHEALQLKYICNNNLSVGEFVSLRSCSFGRPIKEEISKLLTDLWYGILNVKTKEIGQ